MRTVGRMDVNTTRKPARARKGKPAKGRRAAPTVRAARALLVVRSKALAAERDKLRELRSDLDSLVESAEGALSDLESAIDSLSQYV